MIKSDIIGSGVQKPDLFAKLFYWRGVYIQHIYNVNLYNQIVDTIELCG